MASQVCFTKFIKLVGCLVVTLCGLFFIIGRLIGQPPSARVVQELLPLFRNEAFSRDIRKVQSAKGLVDIIDIDKNVYRPNGYTLVNYRKSLIPEIQIQESMTCPQVKKVQV
jgi:hypothetical protein